VQKSKLVEGKKFMWDGVEYAGEREAEDGAAKYRAANFETMTIGEDDRFYVFTRRVVTEIKLEGAPPG
jgi:hypothetical protein